MKTFRAVLRTACGCTQVRMIDARTSGSPPGEYRLTLMRPYRLTDEEPEPNRVVTVNVRVFELRSVGSDECGCRTAYYQEKLDG